MRLRGPDDETAASVLLAADMLDWTVCLCPAALLIVQVGFRRLRCSFKNSFSNIAFAAS
jgi:hypothetical protein